MASKKKKKKRYFDYSLLMIIIFLIGFGLVMLLSCSSYDGMMEHGDSMFYFKSQIGKTLIGFVLMFIVMAGVSVIGSHWYKLSYLVYAGAFGLMLLVRFSPFGRDFNGAKRWLDLPGMPMFQPSECMKIGLILSMAYMVYKLGNKVNEWEGISKCAFLVGVAGLGVFKLTDNLSTGLIVIGIGAIMYFIATKYTKAVAIIYSIGIVGGYLMMRHWGLINVDSGDFRMQRLVAWVAPEKYADGLAFQTVQSMYAIGSGGFFGKGLGNSMQKKIIPEVQNDMILSVISEELGIFGVLIILILFGMLLYRLMFIAQNAPDKFSGFVVTGIFAHIALQVIFNIAVVTNLMPNTGVTLPFISFGGTSTIFLLMEMGIALGVSRKITLQE